MNHTMQEERPMSEKITLLPEGLPKPLGVWSHAVAVRPQYLLFVSGLTARDAQGNVVGVGDISVQTRQVLENLTKTLAAAGGTLADIVSVTVFVRDVRMFDAIHAVRREYFPSAPPASTMVEVTRLVDERCLIEINAVAALDGLSEYTQATLA
jgi:2-iminobutanoate/2-iminopropanoate deaminase